MISGELDLGVKLNKTLCKKWINKLREEIDKQGKFCLCRNGKYCVLGILHSIVHPDFNYLPDYGALIFHPLFSSKGKALNHVLLNKWEKDYDCNSLTSMNDKGFTFSELADIIEEDILPILKD